MIFSNPTMTLFFAGFLGMLVPGAAFLQWLDFRRRADRMPEATKFENLVELVAEKQEEFLSYDEKLKDLAEQEVRRDRAVAEAEEALARKRQADDDLMTLQPRLMELENVNQELARGNEALATISQQLVESKSELNEVKTQLGALPMQKEILEKEIEEFRGAKSNLVDWINGAEQKLDNLRSQIAELEPRKNAILEEIDLKADRLKDISSQILSEWQRLLDIKSQIPVLESTKTSLEASKKNIDKSIEDAQKTFDSLHAKTESLQKSLSEAQSDLRALEETKKTTSTEIERLQKELLLVTAQLDNSRQRVLELKTEISGLEALKAGLEGFVVKAQSIQDEITEKSLEDLLIVPACLEGRTRANSKVTEAEALENVYDSLDKLNLSYSKRVIKSFHTNLKISYISPMVALAGISGTGKSELPKRYAGAMGLHFLQMAVQPRWDSPQDLFGFYNYLEQRYKATELARAMVRLDRWNWPKYAKSYEDKILLVLLDEMNLARVEYYFSEFLSRLEGRKSVDPENELSRQPVEMELDLGRKKGETGTKRVFPAQNVLFVGTMNEDESTQSMSDKVIDRAPVIRFARPKNLVDRPPQPESNNANTANYLPIDTWLTWRKDLDSLSHDVRDNVEKWINRLNKALDVFGRPFGHRLNQAILAYVANHPDMINDQSISNARKAFADQLEQRIFPKLRGLEMEDNNNENSYKEILDLVKEDLQDEELGDAFTKSKEKILFTWLGVNRDEEK